MTVAEFDIVKLLIDKNITNIDEKESLEEDLLKLVGLNIPEREYIIAWTKHYLDEILS